MIRARDMEEDLQAFAAEVLQLDSVFSVWSAMAAFAEERGFPFCTLTMAHRLDGLRSTRFLTSLPDEFRDNYCENGLIGFDPFLNLICQRMATAGIVTDPKHFPDTNKQQGEFLNLTRSLGVKSAICVPVNTNIQPEFGGWVIGGTEDGTAFESMSADSGAHLQMAGFIADERIRALAYLAKRPERNLSPRERECLLWLSAGLRVAKIAHRLGLSEAAVTLYIRNARRKLGARTREQAVARAIQSGEIQP